MNSIAARLTAALATVVVAGFALSSWLLHSALRQSLQQADQAMLTAKLGIVQHFADEAGKSGDTLAFFHHLDDLRLGHEGLHVWVQAHDGALIYDNAALASAGAATRSAVPAGKVEVRQGVLGDRTRWPGARVRIAHETRHREALLSRHLVTLLAVGGAAATATTVMSAWVIRRRLRVLQRLSLQAEQIAVPGARRRLIMPAASIELAGLVQALNGALSRLDQAYEQLEAFNANVAHELRTPLASLISGTQLVLARSRSAAELKDAMASNLEELELLSRLVSDMLFLARADGGDRAGATEPVDLAELARASCHFVEALADDAGVQLGVEGSGTAICNPSLMQRVIVNLLTNAIRHTAAGGTIVTAVEVAAAECRLEVRNPGAPIPEAVRQRMFERFFKGDPSRVRQASSTGLGLAIVAAIATMHGGRAFCVTEGGVNRVGVRWPRPG